jgi:hypothetical protein
MPGDHRPVDLYPGDHTLLLNRQMIGSAIGHLLWVSGVRCQCSASQLVKKMTGQIEKKTLKKRISNIE